MLNHIAFKLLFVLLFSTSLVVSIAFPISLLFVNAALASITAIISFIIAAATIVP
jgi:pilus assembly protein TadC